MNRLMPSGTATAASCIRRLLSGLFLSLCVSVPVLGAEPAATQTVGDLTVSLVLVPSRMVDDDQHRKEVQKQHGSAPAWGNQYHVIASVLDANSRQRLEDVDVRARVIWRDSKLTGAHKRLEPMFFEGRESWGNFFNVPAADPFRIRLDIRRKPKGPVVTIEFPYKQRPHFKPPGK
jgi:hypothetical protein